jgi:radical SAM family uncharacterized protein
MQAETIERALERILPHVEKPARYVGGELNQITKDWDTARTRIALAFPDIYDLGMPNNGLAILYDIVNKQSDMLAERAYLPWNDMESQLREHGIPLYSLESKRPLKDFDIVGISIPYETVYTNVLSLLDLARIPLRTSERTNDDPVVVGGGHAAFNPEPMWAFFDAFVIGEGEEVLVEVANRVGHWRREGSSRAALHHELARIEGVYVPSLYRDHYAPDGSFRSTAPTDPAAPATIRKRIVPQLPPPLTRVIVPNLETVHNRVAIEIMRGCTRGCRFCHAGIVTRPVRERSVTEVVDALETALDATGFAEVGLLSLSSSDYTHVVELVREVRARLGERKLNISLPSLRIESVSVELMEALHGASRRGGFTLAPEAASERMREIINKPVATAQILETAGEIYRRGWHTIKLYFMIGHPEETLEDVEAIADLCESVLRVGRQAIGGRARVNVGVSTFVPKPHTPFQWVPCDSPEQIVAKQQLLRRRLRARAIKLSWTDPKETMLEAWLTRGDRRLADVIQSAWQLGARFDAWQEHFRFDLWQQAFEQHGIDPAYYTHRERSPAEPLPWDHIDCAVNKSFLAEDYSWSQQRRTRVDCRDECFACGILPSFKSVRREHPGQVWQCPDVGRSQAKSATSSMPLPLESPGASSQPSGSGDSEVSA